MRLPSLPALDDSFFEDVEEKKDSSPKKSKESKSSKKEETKSKRRELIIPKTSYDDEGRPVLAIPDLNDIDLNSEIDRFFGKKEG